MRFKMRCQFTERYSPEDKELCRRVNAETFEYLGDAVVLTDHVIEWLNETFRIKVQIESQLVAGFPIICMVIIDAAYGGERIRWQDVDFRVSYKASMQCNYKVLERFWTEVNMDRFREFRPANTDVRFERLLEAECTVAERLKFLDRLRDWYGVRRSTQPIDAMGRRCEIMERSWIYGHKIAFPSWIESPTPGELRQYRESVATNKRRNHDGHREHPQAWPL